MADLTILLEAEKRGILPDDKRSILEEARRRGLVPGGETITLPQRPEGWQFGPEIPEPKARLQWKGPPDQGAIYPLGEDPRQSFVKNVLEGFLDPTQIAANIAGGYSQAGVRGAADWALGGIPSIYKGVRGGVAGLRAGLSAKAREAAIPVEKAVPVPAREVVVPTAPAARAVDEWVRPWEQPLREPPIPQQRGFRPEIHEPVTGGAAITRKYPEMQHGTPGLPPKYVPPSERVTAPTPPTTPSQPLSTPQPRPTPQPVPPPTPEPSATIKDLTNYIAQTGGQGTVPPFFRPPFTRGQADDFFSQTFSWMKNQWQKFRYPPQWTDYKQALGKYLAGRTYSSVETRDFAKQVLSKVPDRDQVAITNWLQHGGDEQALIGWRNKFLTSKQFNLVREAEDAIHLSPENLGIAQQIRSYFDQRWQQATQAGLLDEFVNNYVNQIWGGGSKMAKWISKEVNMGMLRQNPSFIRDRLFTSYFAGEAAGNIPKDKRIGFLVSAYNNAFNEAINARAFVKSMMEARASDGRPVVATSSGITKEGKFVGNIGDVLKKILGRDPTPQEMGLGAGPTFIKPNLADDYISDYLPIDHPAFRKWFAAIADKATGKVVVTEGNLLVHPEVQKHLKQVLARSKLIEHPVGRPVLGVVGTMKGTLLDLSTFHQTQVSLHGLFHRVVASPSLDAQLADPLVKKGVEHGLMIYDHSALAEFAEGVGGHRGLAQMIPGVGNFLRRYQTYLFEEYIPKLKAEMFKHAYQRNMTRYAQPSRLVKHPLSEDQILEMTANQANAAFGELNYKWLGRNPTVQSWLRIFALAPDFLEARARFLGQALKPYGREQFEALALGAASMWMGARIFNMVSNDGDPKFEHPFEWQVGDHLYGFRSVPGDAEHLITGPASFFYSRVSPTLVRPSIEFLVQRNRFGQKVGVGQQAYDLLTSHVPIPLSGLTRLGKEEETSHALFRSVLSAAGVNVRKIKREPWAPHTIHPPRQPTQRKPSQRRGVIGGGGGGPQIGELPPPRQKPPVITEVR